MGANKIRRKSDKSLYKNYEITEIFPFFFWKRCEKCNDEIKRELMWRVDIYGTRWGNIYYEGNINNHKIFCKECFSKTELMDLCEEMC